MSLSIQESLTETKEQQGQDTNGAIMNEQGYAYQDQADQNVEQYLYNGYNAEQYADQQALDIQAAAVNRTYEIDDYSPPSNGWFADYWIEFFYSLAFRVYFTAFMLAALSLFYFIGANWIFATILRIYLPAPSSGNQVLLSLGYCSLFFMLSFTIVTLYSVWENMLKQLWKCDRKYMKIWGFSHQNCTGKEPPYVFYFMFSILMTVVPFIWAIAATVAYSQSVLYFGGMWSFIGTVFAMFLTLLCYIVYYMKAIYRKYTVINLRHAIDDPDNNQYLSLRKNKSSRIKWYRSQALLEEYGLDLRTLKKSTFVCLIGLIPIFAIYTVQNRSTLEGNEGSGTWAAISALAMLFLIFIFMLGISRSPGWAPLTAVLLIAVTFILGLAGAAAGGSAALVGLIVIFFIGSQGLLLRKGPHSLTRREVCAALGLSNDPLEHQLMEKNRWDSSLFCCRNTWLNCFHCIDVKRIFGYRHPEIRQHERRRALQKVTLQTDFKVLLTWWLSLFAALAFVIGIGNSMKYSFSGTIAGPAGTSTVPLDSSSESLCMWRYTANGSNMSLLDFAFLSAVGYSYGPNGDYDFNTWFSSYQTLSQVYPVRNPTSLQQATNGGDVPFRDYYDSATNSHYIVLTSNNYGISLLRNVDDWGDVLTYQMSSIFSPLISCWPSSVVRSFVKGIAFFKQWLPSKGALDAVTSYTEKVASDGAVLLVGDQFNGGYAKIIANQLNISFVAFNAPGVFYTVSAIAEGTDSHYTGYSTFANKGVDVFSPRALTSLIDSHGEAPQSFMLPCSSSISSNKCSSILTTISTISGICGDALNRQLKE